MELSLTAKFIVALLVVSAFNTGLIWIVQLVHYPGFLKVSPNAYVSYQQFHMRAISFIVAPSMLAELLLSLVSLSIGDLGRSYIYWTAIFCLSVVWAVTFFVSVPLHSSLTTRYNAEGIQKLIDTNWWRTAGWSIRTILLAALLLR